MEYEGIDIGIILRPVPRPIHQHHQNCVGGSDRSCLLERTCLLLQDERASLLPKVSKYASC